MNYIAYMSDGSVWSIPVAIIAENRANYYANKDGISFQESLKNDTMPLFESEDFEIHDWATNNMNWDDVKPHATCIKSPEDSGLYQEDWINGEYEVKK